MEGRLPGEDLIEAGIADLRAGRETIPALLVAIGAPRLRRIGHELPDNLPAHPEHRLYYLLGQEHGKGAHSHYNSWIRRLVSYERAAECLKSSSTSSS